MTILFGNVRFRFQDELSSRPERTRISCHAALDKSACAPFYKGKAHEVRQRHQVPQEIRGSVVEGPAVALQGRSRTVHRGLVAGLGAQAFQAEERRDHRVDVFEAVVKRERRPDSGFKAKPA
jgi:hypothetical protein